LPKKILTTPTSYTRTALYRIAKDKIALLSLLVLLVIIGASLFAPWLPIRPPNEIVSEDKLLLPGQKGYVLGTDSLGRDTLSRLIWGGRLSLTAGIASATMALVIGLAIGLAAGFYGGIVDDILMRITDIALAFPVVLLAIGIIAALGPNLLNAMLAVAIAGFPLYARLVRGSVLAAREMDYVLAARALGGRNQHVIFRHLLPNIVSPILVTYTLDIGQKLILTSSLSFLGLGTQPPAPDWGAMVASARTLIRTHPHLIAIPGAVIFLVVLAFNTLGDSLRDALDPRLRRRRSGSTNS
jgi:ABC-type dipeptide/oligopeptide/nickel transport system permease subunit